MKVAQKRRKNFYINFLGNELEKRQLLAQFSYSSGLLTIQTDSTNEQLSIISTSQSGNYTITTSGMWSGSAVSGLSSTITDLFVNQPSGLASILVNDKGGTVSNSSFRFGSSPANFVSNLTVSFTNSSSGAITVANATSFVNGSKLNLTTTRNQITVSACATANSSGSISLTGRNIVVTGNITTAAGDITLYGNGGGSYQNGTFDGVCISGSTVNVNTTGGNISVDGRGGLNSVNAGVNLTSSKVQAGGSGYVTLTGVSGDGTTNAYGILASTVSVTTSTGSITVNGTSCGTALFGRGVYLKSSSIISALGTGNVTITGNAANGTNYARGIEVSGSRVTTSNGTVTANGTSCGTAMGSIGIFLYNANIAATGAGNLAITGTAANGMDEACGILVMVSTVTTSTGSLMVNGTSYGTGTFAKGVYLYSSANISATGRGNVTISGSTPGNTSTGFGFHSYTAGSKVYSNGGLITLAANSLNLAGPVNATSTGNVRIQTLGAGVNLGGVDNTANLGLTSPEIAQITANMLTIGNVNTNNIILSQNISWPTNITLSSKLPTTGTLSNSNRTFTQGNYALTAAGTITIASATLNYTILISSNAPVTYGTSVLLTASVSHSGSAFNTGAISFYNNGVLLGTSNITNNYANYTWSGLAAASYANITATGNVTGATDNGSNTAELTVMPYSLDVTANPQTKIYGESVPSLTYTSATLVNGDSANIFSGSLTTTASDNSGVGDYSITQGQLSAGSNYSISYTSANLSVTPYILHVTASSQSKVYGASVPSLTYTNDSLVNGDTSSVFTGNLTTSGSSNSGVGN